jgi:dTDP-4-dehydrorhamnose 3,5-epimerase-like enzyme
MSNLLNDVLEFQFKKFEEDRGNLVPVTLADDTIFPVKRLFYVWNVPNAEIRGNHAHHKCKQIYVCLHGKIDVLLSDGEHQKTVVLDEPSKAVFVPNGVWSSEQFFDDAILMVLCSHKYALADYIRDYEEYVEWRKS